jgi:hypothetical protein
VKWDIDMQEVQVVEEELGGVQEQEPEYQPYQLTRFYWNQLDHVHEDYQRWEENEYYHNCQQFEDTIWRIYEIHQQQQQQEEQLQQVQWQQDDNVPVVVDNIIIDISMENIDEENIILNSNKIDEENIIINNNNDVEEKIIINNNDDNEENIIINNSNNDEENIFINNDHEDIIIIDNNNRND